MGRPPEKMGQGQCEYIKDDGQRCKAPAVDGAGRCISHTEVPRYVEARTRSHIKGGLAARAKYAVQPSDELPEVDLQSIDDLLALQERAAQVALALLQKDPGNLAAAKELSLISKRAADVIKLTKLSKEWQEIENMVRELRGKGK